MSCTHFFGFTFRINFTFDIQYTFLVRLMVLTRKKVAAIIELSMVSLFVINYSFGILNQIYDDNSQLDCLARKYWFHFLLDTFFLCISIMIRPFGHISYNFYEFTTKTDTLNYLSRLPKNHYDASFRFDN